ncbi:hypothetical protein [Listeria monocytogenes]|uniref:hypothetical protein n=1 Tax=Listeria monocytogenes TaxID=1639 RepID=UPI0010EB92E9|nr:hypothetical protein [Listeria monocytogenes]EAD5509218.1 hypothetical protein [Listeria monocytogenes]ECC0312013.1 hypothetical protein [Listeria monocytogenes]EJQ3348396.1 hypothetical protein [Listeria monocytogenes]EJS5844694.1 hypothetical protein [Listeria monocytogenes]EJS5944996.1 hypothetical protein [Listeria monocytogenes]
MTEKIQYILVDYDENDNVLIISDDKKDCLNIIKTVLGDDIAIGVYDVDLEEVMENAYWDDYGFKIFEYKITEAVN